MLYERYLTPKSMKSRLHLHFCITQMVFNKQQKRKLQQKIYMAKFGEKTDKLMKNRKNRQVGSQQQVGSYFKCDF